MSKRMQEYRNELNLIGNCNPKTQKALFQYAHGDSTRVIVDYPTTTETWAAE